MRLFFRFAAARIDNQDKTTRDDLAITLAGYANQENIGGISVYGGPLE